MEHPGLEAGKGPRPPFVACPACVCPWQPGQHVCGPGPDRGKKTIEKFPARIHELAVFHTASGLLTIRLRANSAQPKGRQKLFGVRMENFF